MNKTVKCVIWDLDETVWNGILLENEAVHLRPGIREILTNWINGAFSSQLRAEMITVMPCKCCAISKSIIISLSANQLGSQILVRSNDTEGAQYRRRFAGLCGRSAV